MKDYEKLVVLIVGLILLSQPMSITVSEKSCTLLREATVEPSFTYILVGGAGSNPDFWTQDVFNDYIQDEINPIFDSSPSLRERMNIYMIWDESVDVCENTYEDNTYQVCCRWDIQKKHIDYILSEYSSCTGEYPEKVFYEFFWSDGRKCDNRAQPPRLVFFRPTFDLELAVKEPEKLVRGFSGNLITFCKPSGYIAPSGEAMPICEHEMLHDFCMYHSDPCETFKDCDYIVNQYMLEWANPVTTTTVATTTTTIPYYTTVPYYSTTTYPTTTVETTTTISAVTTVPQKYCGNGICEPTESFQNCWQDCNPVKNILEVIEEIITQIVEFLRGFSSEV